MRHIAFIMDGNGRWADKHGKTRQYGHEPGSSNVYDIFLSCIELDINTATFFAMSSENMNRPREETEFISILLNNSIKKYLPELLDNQIKFMVIGDISHLPEQIKTTIKYAEEVTSKFTKYKLNIAYNYGGQWDIVNSINTLLNKKLTISYENLSKYLSTGNDFPDLIVRTGGYKRLSNFMLWQASYSELIFLETLWPDFSSSDVSNILDNYKSIKRKFGKVD
ncbi:MAG: polyprenyl diphosphate synthase [Pseudomonadota bacterium]|nr:polyprenyl diphosphate synthase [Pseudomonadota bacterium]